jgi:hypothetical protein
MFPRLYRLAFAIPSNIYVSAFRHFVTNNTINDAMDK